MESVGGTIGFLGPTPAHLIMDARVDIERLKVLRHLSMGGSARDPIRPAALSSVLGSRLALQFVMTELGARLCCSGESSSVKMAR